MIPILFNTEMVKAILEGRKTVTRRIIKGTRSSFNLTDLDTDPAVGITNKQGELIPKDVKGLYATFEADDSYPIEYPMFKSPYQVGDILYVRETWIESSFGYVYRASDYSIIEEWAGEEIKWKPSIFMPKEAARIFLKVTNVRVERLQDMTEDDVCYEGAEKLINSCEHMDYSVVPPEPCYNTCNACKNCIIDISYQELFGEQVWDQTIKKKDLDKYGWKANPWVWVIEFEKIQTMSDDLHDFLMND